MSSLTSLMGRATSAAATPETSSSSMQTFSRQRAPCLRRDTLVGELLVGGGDGVRGDGFGGVLDASFGELLVGLGTRGKIGIFEIVSSLFVRIL
ncbi:hypothetical protein E2562_034859 [Oryza meyeriana var. granulata]|uniref:Uncharacterized protein n=1 Tax=Oryza meyeriana var. granulata TaxID=110450 RepID=A0A6G1E765_9ORYZ|nr:hypothetical protein E2562_034859 [Oryza meyeriana var. granulata]